MSEYITRADFWQETTDTEGVVPAGCPTRVEAQDGTAWEDVSKHDRLIGGWLRTQRVFIDSRWMPPLKVGDKVTSVEQLNALPIKAVVKDTSDDIWQKFIGRYEWEDRWYGVGADRSMSSKELLRKFSPITIIYLPEGADQ